MERREETGDRRQRQKTETGDRDRRQRRKKNRERWALR